MAEGLIFRNMFQISRMQTAMVSRSEHPMKIREIVISFEFFVKSLTWNAALCLSKTRFK